MPSSQVTRITDIGHGTCHLHNPPVSYTTTFYQGDPVVFADELNVMRIGDLGHASCGHDTIALTGSAVSFGSNGQGLHRIGDIGHIIGSQESTYTVITGSHNVDSE